MVNGTMFTDSFETQLPLAIAYYFGNIVISNFITLRYALPCGHVILDMIETSVTKGAEPTPRIKETFENLKIFLREMRNNNITNTLQTAEFCLLPFLYSKQKFVNVDNGE